MSLKLYTYAKCSTCRNAVAWLRERGVAFTECAIRETPPRPEELRTMLAAYDGELRRIFNTSGMDYRAQGLAQTLPTLSTDEALGLLGQNGNLVKRPFLIGTRDDGRSVSLVGFKEAEWAARMTEE